MLGIKWAIIEDGNIQLIPLKTKKKQQIIETFDDLSEAIIALKFYKFFLGK